MADSYNKIGFAGVNLVKGKYKPDDLTVLKAQNAELVFDKDKGGRASLRKRGGWVSNGDAFGGGIYEMFPIGTIDEITPDPPPSSGFIFRPIADVSNSGVDGGFTVEPLWSSLDEVVPDDLDFIQAISQDTAPYNRCIMDMTVVVFTGVATSGTARIRAKYTDNGGGNNSSLVVTFSSGATTIAQCSLQSAIIGNLTESYVTYEFDILTNGYLGGSFDWSTVQVEVLGADDFGGTPDLNTSDVSFIELELAHA